LDGTCAGLEWIGAQDQVEYPFAGCLACAKDNWITSGVPGGNAEDDLALARELRLRIARIR
jgi:hypothetical protein